jgi:hypothetical protein
VQSARATQAKKIVDSSSFARGSVKVPELALVERDAGTIPEQVLEYLLFGQISSQELLLLSRHDMLNGQSLSYQIIKDINDVAFEYSSNNIISLPGTLSEVFRQYGIVLENYIPITNPDLPTGQDYWQHFYVEVEDGTPFVVIEFQNIQDNMLVELEVMASGDSVSTGHGLA